MDIVAANEVATLIQEGYSDDLLQAANTGSTVLQTFGSVPVGSRVTNMPVLAALPEAKWVNGETGVKSKSVAKWGNKRLVVEELAVIIPVAENTIDDASAAVLTNIATLGGQAIARKLDRTIIFGIDKPSTWTSPALLPAAVAASQTFAPTTGAGPGDLAGVFYKAAEKLDDVGYDPDVAMAPKGLRFRVANLRDADGRKLLESDGGVDSLAGLTTGWAVGGSWDRASALAIIADRSRVIVGVRQDVTVKFLDQATLTGEDGELINLAEQDMVALRFKARYAYVLGDGTTSEGTNKTPVAAIVPGA